MKPLTSAVLILGALVNFSFAQGATPEPTPFETFASKPSAQVLFTQQVGSIDSSDAKVKITALIVEDTEHSPNQMRGVRFDLENNSKGDQVYLDEAQLVSVKRDLIGIERYFPRIIKSDDSAQHQVMGTENCRMPDEPRRILCPEIYGGPDHSGLTLRALRGPIFEFPDHKPSELADLIDHAIVELKQH